MYDVNTCYYLNQMGIRPWIRKTLSAPKAYWVVMVSSTLQRNAQELLQQILQFLQDEQLIHVIKVTKEDSEDQVSQILKQYSPQKIFVFGMHLADFFTNEAKYPTVLTLCPSQLIQQPSKKKQVFYELLQAKHS
jgi:superfamily II DNA/RNA helicase